MQPSLLGAGQPVQPKYVPYYADRWNDLTRVMQQALDRSTKEGNGKLFRVDAGDMFREYLLAFKTMQDRQYHDCRCCSSFLSHHGNLVWMNGIGHTKSALWDETMLPARHPYRTIVKAMRVAVENASVVEQAFWDEQVWGPREQGGFEHLSVRISGASHTGKINTATQEAAAARENRRHLERALQELTSHHTDRAVAMLQAGSLSRGEKLLPMAQFLADTHREVRNHSGTEMRNRMLWLAVSKAGAGWCTPRASALGALIEDIDSGASISTITRKHNERMGPLKYQRPTAPTSEGNVRDAERLFERLGLAAALRRRFATAKELVHLWLPKPPTAGQEPGIFGHLVSGRRATAEANLTAGAVRMTFAKFRRDVLPRALELEAMVPRHGQFCAFTTAVDRSAPPLLAWDSEECRNPYAWYVYHNGSPARQWSLVGDQRTAVAAIALMPSSWAGEEGRWAELGKRALLVLDGAHDVANRSLALFPECLRGELHGVRRTIEAHSRSSKLELPPKGEQHASGLLVGDGCEVRLVVRTAEGLGSYVIDRWE